MTVHGAALVSLFAEDEGVPGDILSRQGSSRAIAPEKAPGPEFGI